MELNIRHDDRISEVYWAALRGDEKSLLQLLHKNESIVANIPEGIQTPLHISALLGHVPFTVALLHHGSYLAYRVDSCGRTALHLASAEGHIHIVRVLLQVTNETCLNRDREGRTPLHYAAMRGRTEVVQELIMARPDSLSLGDAEGSTVFHLCVTYNHLNTLETLVKLDYATTNITARHPPRLPIFTCSDRDGNTILHLAIMSNQVEVVRYLRSIPEIREIAHSENKKGLTSHNILGTDLVPPQNDGRWIKFWMKWIWYYYVKSLYDWWMRDGDKWVEEMKGNLSVVSTFIATVTFAGLINPPAGFIQQGLSSSSSSGNNTSSNNVTSSDDDPLGCITLFPDNNTFCPGQALASSPHLHSGFNSYIFYITVSFFSSLSITLLLISGILPMKNKFVIWMISIGISIALTSLAAAYVTAINMIIPSHILKEKLISSMNNAVLYKVWSVLLAIIVSMITLRFYFWVLKKSSRWGRQHVFLSKLLRIIAFLVLLSAPSYVITFVFDFFSV